MCVIVSELHGSLLSQNLIIDNHKQKVSDFGT